VVQRYPAHPDHPVRGRLNAAVFSLLDGYADRLFGERKRKLFHDLPDEVVELGPGTGANFRYYRPGTRVVAIEPNRRMHRALRASAVRYGMDLVLREESAERLSLADATVDAVVSTLVLCTVPDPVRTAGEILRVLRPGARLVLLEHVAAPPGDYHRVVQRAIRRPWHWFFEGCDPCRDTESTLRRAGFTEVNVDQYTVRTPLIPIGCQIAGYAVP
jgi:SAM-dependent methyltransferase